MVFVVMQYDLSLFLQIPAAGMIEHLHISPPKALVIVLFLCLHFTMRSYHSINHAKKPKVCLRPGRNVSADRSC